MIYTRQSIMNSLERIENKIESKKKEISELYEDLDRMESKLKALDEYEKSPISHRTLKKYISEHTGSVAMMDEFESVTEEGFKRYERLFVQNTVYISGKSCHYIIERMSGNDYVGDITMTNFKQGYTSSLRKHAASELEKVDFDKIKEGEKVIRFTKPYLLRAQNSSNRTGYGSEYNGYDLVYQGTLYGETTRYAFVGVMLD